MPRLKVFTWNMQRGASISEKNSISNSEYTQKAQARLKLLTKLCEDHDVGFITEAGKDLSDAIDTPNTTSVLLPKGQGYWNVAEKEGTQDLKAGCRCLLFCKGIAESRKINFYSGKLKASRYPAAATNDDVLLVSFHATSGGGGGDNINSLVERLVDGVGPNLIHPNHYKLVIIGGDFNSNRSFISQPKKNTHQSPNGSGAILDGFFCTHRMGSDSRIKITIEPKIFRSHPKDGFGGGNFSTGWWTALNNNLFMRVSDHAPVSAVIEYEHHDH